MTSTVGLALDAEMALATLSDDDHQEVMELVVAALVDPNSWPLPGGWDWGLRWGPRLRIVFTVYLGGIDVVALGANDGSSQAA